MDGGPPRAIAGLTAVLSYKNTSISLDYVLLLASPSLFLSAQHVLLETGRIDYLVVPRTRGRVDIAGILFSGPCCYPRFGRARLISAFDGGHSRDG